MSYFIHFATEKRKKRYQMEDEYRERTQHSARRHYRRKTNMKMHTCLYSLEFIDEAAQLLYVRMPNGRFTTMPCFSVPLAAEMLQKLYPTVWRWIDSGILPSPVLKYYKGRISAPSSIYHLEEVRIFVEEIGEHEKTSSYLRHDHINVITRIAHRVKAFRKQRGLT